MTRGSVWKSVKKVNYQNLLKNCEQSPTFALQKVLGKAEGFVIPALSQLLENNDGQNDHPGRAYSLLPYERSIMREMEVSPKSHF